MRSSPQVNRLPRSMQWEEDLMEYLPLSTVESQLGVTWCALAISASEEGDRRLEVDEAVSEPALNDDPKGGKVDREDAHKVRGNRNASRRTPVETEGVIEADGVSEQERRELVKKPEPDRNPGHEAHRQGSVKVRPGA